ncbi:MAG TPA: glycoside hydrolase family 3 N-terminal domain-containing protein [Candidatus Limnocylindrales bacterium]|nr:glycoside hydrolase family 3 N-terminal domain-containing protein [Candidatus Limnocylindrales bacterium]
MGTAGVPRLPAVTGIMGVRSVVGKGAIARATRGFTATALAVSLMAAGLGSDAVAAGPTMAQLIGQKLVVRMEGATPSADLLGRIRRGEVGGIVLFGPNITTPTALVALTTKLRAAAAAGGQPRLLIAVDQEGGSVKRIPWIPPTLSAPQMGAIARASVALAQGASTAAALHGLGIDVDFAPVADVPASTASFMYRDGRTFSFSAPRTAALADGFATGLESKGVVPAMKHFPGIGFATRNTDVYVDTITASAAALAAGLLPYRLAIGHHIPMIMLSNATYTAYDAHNAAGWSRTIVDTLLRHDLGFTGVTITDSLDGTAKARGLWPRVLAISAARAGTDMILTTGTEASTAGVYATLLRQAQEGTIPLATLRASYDRILDLKAGL